MNQVVEEMMAILTGDDDLAHYGMPRRSGRYPWGSGDDPYQRTGDFLSRVEKLKAEGWTETAENIEKEFGLSTGDYRKEKSICKDQRRLMDVARVKSLKADGLSNSEIGRIMGKNESSIRELLDKEKEARMMAVGATVKFLRDQVDEKGMIDVGVGVAKEIDVSDSLGRKLNISEDRLNTALYYLEKKEGYHVYPGRFEQPTNPGQWTTQKVLAKPEIGYKEIYNYDQVKTITDYISRDGGDTFEKKFNYPASMDSKRLMIRYKEDGGIDKDGLVELRRGVDDLSLGESRFSQVRILVDGTHYIKGMAAYSDDMPPGVDVVFNTNKSKDKPMTEVLKKITDDPENPFGSLIKDADQGGQYWYTDKKTGEKKLGLINKRADEGDWSEWKDTLPSQFLGKQSKALAKKQLDLAKADKKAEFDEICALTNPTVKKHLLQKFSDECDAAAVDLKAAALPGQKYHVIVPINTLKDNEVYAPRYEPGTQLALIRYPHGGTFEIPILTVNNKNPLARNVIGKEASDGIGINAKVAERLSGADFDGDTVMCIPTNDAGGRVKIASKRELEGLKGFDPKLEYGPESYKGRDVKLMSKGSIGKEMGTISNLITDMTLAGADEKELARAVRHSMVVIDAHKHKLDYKKSEADNNITALKKQYQPKYDAEGNLIGYGGAATILSKAKGEYTVNKRQGSSTVNVEVNPLNGKINPKYDPTRPEGAKIYKEADDLYYVDPKSYKYDKKTGTYTVRTNDGKKITYTSKDKELVDKYEPVEVKDPVTKKVIGYTSADGSITYKKKARTQPSTNMAETDDAYSLVSAARHPMEVLYADHANYMKALGNQARKEMVSTGDIKYKASSKAAYQKEVDSLMAKLNEAEKNVTRERAATRAAAAVVKAKKAAGITDKKDLRKAGQQAVSKYRSEYGSVSRKDRNIKITDKEWEAIQSGAISPTTLKRILNNTDISVIREYATPRTNKTTLTSSKVNQIKRMSASNYTLDEIARKLGISPSTVSKYLKGVN